MPSEETQFKPGQSGNPAGRPKGSRNKLSEAFIEALNDSFADQGPEIVQRVIEADPDKYLNIIAKLMPKLLELSGPDGESIPINGTLKVVDSRRKQS